MKGVTLSCCCSLDNSALINHIKCWEERKHLQFRTNCFAFCDAFVFAILLCLKVTCSLTPTLTFHPTHVLTFIHRLGLPCIFFFFSLGMDLMLSAPRVGTWRALALHLQPSVQEKFSASLLFGFSICPRGTSGQWGQYRMWACCYGASQ